MTGPVLSWKQAHKFGYAPRQYSHLPGTFPDDWLLAILDFKVWAGKVLAIDGYFTLADTGRKIILSVYLAAGQTYRIGSSAIDFYRCPIGCQYHLKVNLNRKGKPVLMDILQL